MYNQLAIEIIKHEEKVLLYYSPENRTGWLYSKLFEEDKTYRIKSIFHVSKGDIFFDESESIVKNDDDIFFLIGESFNDEYYRFFKNIFGTKYDILISKNCNITTKYFGVEFKINTIKMFEDIIQAQIIIGNAQNDDENVIPIEIFENLIAKFPTAREKDLYVRSKIRNILSEYVSNTKNYTKLFENYIKKKNSKFKYISNTYNSIKEYEIEKYSFLLAELKNMLNNVNFYSEYDWQNKILEFILLLFPQYIFHLKEVTLDKKYIDTEQSKRIDIALFDSNGAIDIIEIKSPRAGKIISDKPYDRNNYVPSRLLSNTIMQLEKYLHYLNKLGINGEKALSQKYQKTLDTYKVQIKIINPKGIIIAGRSNNFSKEQKEDFKVIRRKYARVIDIITYDDLISRLENTINALKKEI